MRFRENGLWLMSEWDFEPAEWGGIGFPYVDSQNKLTDGGERAGAIVAIWIATSTKVRTARRKKKKVVGFAELSGKINDISKFVSWKALVKHFEDSDNKNRWPYAVGVKQAWKVVGNIQQDLEHNWQDVDYIFSTTYIPNEARDIGTNARMVEMEEHFHRISNLSIEPAKVYPQDVLPPEHEEPEIRTAGALLRIRGVLDE
ncbi:MAG: hypothetical protein K8953_10965 [Proteobacteria bacterium]|nr:hypothetical protein [Pseudomonadota bacterium]